MFSYPSISARVLVLTAFIMSATSVAAFALSNSDEKAKADALEPRLPAVNDGPYIFVNDQQQLESSWLCQGELVSQTVSVSTFPKVMNACNMPATVHGLMSLENKVLEFSGDYPVAALSDFHGKYDLMIELLTNNNIIDENKNWAFGDGHFVITGDIFDRGDKVTEILWFFI